MSSAPNNRFLSLDQDTNQFLVYAGLNTISLIQLSEILPIELTATHTFITNIDLIGRTET